MESSGQEEAIMFVERRLDYFISKLTICENVMATELNDIIKFANELLEILSEMQMSLLSIDAETRAKITQFLEKIKEVLKALSKKHRKLGRAVTSVAKVIDYNFIMIISFPTNLTIDEENMILNKLIAKHYCRQGMDDVVKLLIKEADMSEGMIFDIFDSEFSYHDIYRIWQQLQEHNLKPALEWVENLSDYLKAKNCTLEFELYQLKVMQILSKDIPCEEARKEAISYALCHFSNLRNEKKEIHLMAYLAVYPRGIDWPIYEDLNYNTIWTHVCNVFLKNACCVLDISKDSALSVLLNIGCTSLSALLNSTMETSFSDENLDEKFWYHSTFVCPVLKQQTNEDNPPIKLICGHVISINGLRDFINAIYKLKCPYCSTEQRWTDLVRVNF